MTQTNLTVTYEAQPYRKSCIKKQLSLPDDNYEIELFLSHRSRKAHGTFVSRFINGANAEKVIVL